MLARSGVFATGVNAGKHRLETVRIAIQDKGRSSGPSTIHTCHFEGLAVTV